MKGKALNYFIFYLFSIKKFQFPPILTIPIMHSFGVRACSGAWLIPLSARELSVPKFIYLSGYRFAIYVMHDVTCLKTCRNVQVIQQLKSFVILFTIRQLENPYRARKRFSGHHLSKKKACNNYSVIFK